MFKVKFGEKHIETDNCREAIATYVYHKLLGTDNVKFLQFLGEDDEGWEHWKVIKHPISHYEINIEELDN